MFSSTEKKGLGSTESARPPMPVARNPSITAVDLICSNGTACSGLLKCRCLKDSRRDWLVFALHPLFLSWSWSCDISSWLAWGCILCTNLPKTGPKVIYKTWLYHHRVFHQVLVWNSSGGRLTPWVRENCKHRRIGNKNTGKNRCTQLNTIETFPFCSLTASQVIQG